MRVLLVDLNPFMAAVAPLSLGSLAAVLRRDGHRAEVLSLGADSAFSPAGFAAWLRERDPELVGFATYQRNLAHVRALARLVREQLPGCRIVLGGPQAMFLPEQALAGLGEVDFLSRGEGEPTIQALVAALEAGATGEPIPGVTTRLPEGATLTGPPIEPPDDLDRYPSPWLEGVLDPAEWDQAVLLGSRGCTHRCLFCLTPAANGGTTRCHGSDRVLEEIAYVAARGSGRLWFADPNFCVSRERVVALLEGIVARGLTVRMWIELRAEMVTAELVPLLARAGVERVAMGLESASEAVLAGLGKGIEPALVGRAARCLLAAGVDVELFSQYALPGETLQDAMATLRFVRGSGVAIRGNSNAQQMQLYFGSPVAECPGAYGIRPLRASLPPHLAVGTEFETDWMSAAEIQRARAAWCEASTDGGQRIVS